MALCPRSSFLRNGACPLGPADHRPPYSALGRICIFASVTVSTAARDERTGK